jgi:hypothetical protein
VPDFFPLFAASKGQPVQHEGQTIQLMDRFPIGRRCTLRLVRESTSSEWRQGIHLETDQGITIAGTRYRHPLVVWEDTAPQEFELTAFGKSGDLEVWNVWDTGDGKTDAWLNGGAMIVEDLPNGRRYRCNDGEPDDDFDDIVFRIERVEDDLPNPG